MKLRLPYRWEEMSNWHVATCPLCGKTVAWITEEAVVRYRVDVPRWVVHECRIR